jgi:sterol desaturase/sphingolipid hydroxylase (fatty acid hydroxylase superfamily)
LGILESVLTEGIVESFVAFAKSSSVLLLNAFLRLLLSPLLPGDRLFWVYLLSSFAAVVGVYLFVRRKQRLSGEGGSVGARDFFRFCFPRSVWDSPSAWLDVRYFFVNATFQIAILPFFQIGYVTALALGTKSWIMGRYGTAPLWEYRDSELAAITCTVALFLLVDFVSYVMHVLQHKVPFLWEFHKVHHSSVVLHPLTNFREHPFDNIFYQWGAGLTNGVGIGLLLCLFDDYRTVQVLGVAALNFIFYLGAYHLRHSHIWLAWPPSLGRIFGSPANHQIHHSAEARHIDKNFGFGFAIWDWMFGTLYLPREPETLRYGLGDGTESEYSSTLRLYFLPFRKVFQSATRRLHRA